MTVLVVSAWLPEQRELRRRSEVALDATTEAGAGSNGMARVPWARCEFLLTGIGPVRAAAAVASRLAQGNGPGPSDAADPSCPGALPCLTGDVSLVVFVGTAGAYEPARHSLCSAWPVTRVRFTDGAAARGESYFPGRGEILSHEEWDSPLPSKGNTLCVCPPSITKTVEQANALALLGDLENLELAGLAAACQAARTPVPWVAFLGVSNVVGPSAHGEWKLWHEEASLRAQECAERFLADPGRGFGS